MSGNHIQFVCMCLVLLATNSAICAVEFAGGMGEPNDPYQIATARQLTSIGSDPNLLNKHFVLLNDIDLAPRQPGGLAFTRAVIAPGEDAPFWESSYWKGVPFTGTFNGRGHSLKNLTFQGTMRNFIGLFGNVAKGGLVSDLKVEDANLNRQNAVYHSVLVAWNEGRMVRCGATGRIVGNLYAGMLTGFNRGEVIDCWAEGDVSGTGDIGGLVGANSFGMIVNSHAACRVDITDRADFNCGGGLLGESLNGAIVNCWASGDVSGVWGSSLLGGLVEMSAGALVANCFATGNVSVERRGEAVGGLVGSGRTIDDCYATGNVSAGDGSSLGGLVGDSASITDSYAIGQVSLGQHNENVGGLVGKASHIYVKGCFWKR